MVEEFQEADIMWPDSGHGKRADAAGDARFPHRRISRGVSPPIDIPPRPQAVRYALKNSGRGGGDGDDDDDDGDEGDDTSEGKYEAAFPPHVLLARRISGEAAASSSVCVGNGRTLKGRDLNYFRDSVLRMTGFLEA